MYRLFCVLCFVIVISMCAMSEVAPVGWACGPFSGAVRARARARMRGVVFPRFSAWRENRRG